MKAAPWIIITALVLLLMGERSCAPDGDYVPMPTVITHTDTIPGDSIPYRVTIAKPYPVRVDCLHWQDRPVDTLAILQAYYTRRIYHDTLKNDTSALVIVLDTVAYNQLSTRSLIFQNRRPIGISTTTVIQPPADARRLKLFVGPCLGRSPTNFALGASAMLLTKTEAAYALSFDAINNDAYFSIYWKITLSRNKDPSPP